MRASPRSSKLDGVPLIEDASQSFGRQWEGKHLGSFGALSVFSLNGNKTLTTGAGGLLCVRALNVAKPSSWSASALISFQLE